MDAANAMFTSSSGSVYLIGPGEASCLALSEILNEKQIKNVISIDERTMRILVEKPENLEKLLSRKLHTRVNLKKENFERFNGFKIIRSAELVYVIYKKDLTRLKDKQTLDALLWAVKFKGCSISEDEIQEIQKLG